MTPDGRLRATTPEGDETIVADDAPSASDGVGLSGVLTPTVDGDSAVDPAVVRELLRRIGLLPADAGADADGDATSARAERSEAGLVRAAVSVHGDWRNGLLRGRWAKDRAAFIGRAAREAARRRRLQDAEALAARLRQDVAAVEAEIEALLARQRRVEAERDARPDEGPLRAASADLAKAAQALAAATERLARATAVRDAARKSLDDADAEAARTADDLRLPRDPDALETIESALRRLAVLLPQLWAAIDRRREDHDRLADARTTREQATVRLRERTERRAAADAERRDAEVFRDTLAATVGTAVEELQRRRREVSVRRRQIEQELKTANAEREAAGRAEAAEERDLEVRAEELTAEEERRTAAADRLRRFASTGVLAAALPDLELPTTEAAWSDTAAVRVARRIDQLLADEPDGDEAWRRSLRAVGDDVTPLAEALVVTGDHVAVQTVDEGILVVGVRFRGDELSVAGLAEALRVDVEERRRILGEREREILENHLVDEVAATLQRRISDAEHQVERMTRELGARPTSTGMQLRLRWVPVEDGPAGLGAARQRLMRQSAAVWSAEDRAAVGQFLRAQIDALRAADPSRPWLEHLMEAFDYRSWHRFVVERRGPGGWTSAAGPASGGERVLAATVPLFAAASAHYGSAGDPHAPRLVLLDEAFAGVDDDSRAKCLGLLTAFDLDVVMTSEREWGCYPEVPGLAISQLSRVEGYDAILVTPWEWDGRTRTQVDPPPRAERQTVVGATGATDMDPDQVSLLDALGGEGESGDPDGGAASPEEPFDGGAASPEGPDNDMPGPG